MSRKEEQYERTEAVQQEEAELSEEDLEEAAGGWNELLPGNSTVPKDNDGGILGNLS